MAWPSISVSALPLVLAGPILRKVSPTSVSVWVMLKSEATAYLTVKNPSGTAVAYTDPIATVRIGEYLHLALLTAKTEDAELKPGVIYHYDVSFTVGTKNYTLATATASASFAYPGQSGPTFVLPPDTLEDVRIISGSCRKPHGENTDALEILDDLIYVANDDPKARPHLLLLGGDQIYADDVADDLLTAISGAAKTLMGWEETITVGNDTKPVGGTSTPGGYLRSVIVKAAGSTSDDVKTQLMSFGEYLTMYLFAWSDVLWPTTALTGSGQPQHVEHYRTALPKVRRALANIPSYMILDDHEVTDDFNMSKKFCDQIYGDAMGRRIIQNGLLAYTLCQAWGNDPSLDVSKVVNKLLGVKTASAYESVTSDLAVLVGVADKTELASRTPYAVGHAFGSYDFNFTVEGKAFQIVVTDSRTWRSFPGGDDEHSILIPDGVLSSQINSTPSLGDRALIVVVTTNAPPIASFRLAAAHPTFADPYVNDTIDSWELPSLATDQLLVHLTNKFDPDANGNRSCRVVLVSGDVHFSFASRLQYWADKRLGDTSSTPTKAVFAQLVSSALKNEKGDTRGLHDKGYTYVPDMKGVKGSIKEWLAKSIMPLFAPEEFAGWNVSHLTRVGSNETGGSVPTSPDQPTVEIDPDMVFDTAPDYRYRLEYLETSAASSYPGDPPTLAQIAGAASVDGGIALAAYYESAMAYHEYAKSPGKARQIVGKNNIGEITFKWGAGDSKTVYYTMRWREKDTISWARYAVSLSLADTHKPKLPGID